jgi:hypothetical protein
MTSGGNAGTNKKPQNNAEAFLFFTVYLRLCVEVYIRGYLVV